MKQAAGGGDDDTDTLPVINPSGVTHVVTDNQQTAGTYQQVSRYNTWFSNGESWDTPTEQSGDFNGYPVFYCQDLDMYLFYYNHGSGNCWALNHYVMNWNTPADPYLFVDYVTSDQTAPSSGQWYGGSRVDGGNDQSGGGSSEDPECFITGTKITLADRTTKNIEDITYDDELLVWNFDEGKYDSAKPLWIRKKGVINYWHNNKFADGTVLKTVGTRTKAHRMFNLDKGSFDYLSECVGCSAVMDDGTATRLESTKVVESRVEYYNVITTKHMNLYANGILTSCSLNNLYPIKDMKFVKTENVAETDMSDIPKSFIDGLRLTEQPGNMTEYVRRLLANAK